MQVTIAELCQKLNRDSAAERTLINGWVQTNVMVGKATIIGTVDKAPGTRGRKAQIFDIPDVILQQILPQESV